MKRRRHNPQAGVTLIEMLVVVTIIALFAALVGRNLFKQSDKARVAAARAQIEMFMGALNLYKLDTGSLPTTEQG
ncbi:MAG TPA: type II secretion system protein GspG, partial [Bryobacteraceae bacterium]|nr:type II secretion system protein GspG [Bryobacteraceae bacterium]